MTVATPERRNDLRFMVVDKSAHTRWWQETYARANAMIELQGGMRLYVTEPFAALAQHGSAFAFIRVHVVTSEKPDDLHRVINLPVLDRLIPVVRIRAITPIQDEAL